MTTAEILGSAKSRLAEAFGARLRAVVLYGSEARGEARPDSDLDLLVVLATPCDAAAQVPAIVDALYPLILTSGRRIDAQPVDEQTFRAAQYGLYRNAQTDGVVL